MVDVSIVFLIPSLFPSTLEITFYNFRKPLSLTSPFPSTSTSTRWSKFMKYLSKMYYQQKFLLCMEFWVEFFAFSLIRRNGKAWRLISLLPPPLHPNSIWNKQTHRLPLQFIYTNSKFDSILKMLSRASNTNSHNKTKTHKSNVNRRTV